MDTERPAEFGEEFLGTVMMNADTRIEDTLIYTMTRKYNFKVTGSIDRHLVASIPTFAYKVNSNDSKEQEPFFGFGNISNKAKVGHLGVSGVTRYLKAKQIPPSLLKSPLFSIFHNTRNVLFVSFKALDTLIRCPVIAISCVQLFLERAGWALRNTRFGVVPGFVLSALSVVTSGVLSIAKVLVEFFRTPFAVMGAAVGFVFGGITGLATRGGDGFKHPLKCLFEGTIDGIRPFAPGLAENLTFYQEGNYKASTVATPWGAMIGSALGIALVAALSVQNLGGIAGMTEFAPFIFSHLGLTPFATLLGLAGAHIGVAFAALGLIGACSKACSTLWNGANAVLHDTAALVRGTAPVIMAGTSRRNVNLTVFVNTRNSQPPTPNSDQPSPATPNTPSASSATAALMTPTAPVIVPPQTPVPNPNSPRLQAN